MQTETSLSILFWIKKNRQVNGKSLLYSRITINGKRCEISTNLKVLINEWNARLQCIRGKSSESKSLNNEIAIIRSKLLATYRHLTVADKTTTIEEFKNAYFGIAENARTLIPIIEQHNKDIFKLIGKGYTRPTWIKYQTTLKHIAEFLRQKYNIKDIGIQKLNHEFITSFEFYLKSEKNIDTNTNGKYIKNLKKIVRECVAKDWLAKDPFLGYKIKVKKTNIEFLSLNELQLINSKHFSVSRLQIIKEIFLFSCYTGLSYVDLFNLTHDKIVIGIDGSKWIYTSRQKTSIDSRIPILPQAQEIINKYMHGIKSTVNDKLFPVPSNQKVNAYLKEIADCCGINKNLTFHMARHTFATTITLTNGVPIETVSKMLGHTKIQTTQIYAKVIDQKVGNDMTLLKEKFLQGNKAPLFNKIK